ncbi:hypothetical protein AB0D04_37320, partial [Streptomyces sp. NPDC048483]|uniref:hypothetical protein n=1 Tax=Streptomyces sp. NPDC048483 TaxID=3154927 RepID=UPI00341875DA
DEQRLGRVQVPYRLVQIGLTESRKRDSWAGYGLDGVSCFLTGRCFLGSRLLVNPNLVRVPLQRSPEVGGMTLFGYRCLLVPPAMSIPQRGVAGWHPLQGLL